MKAVYNDSGIPEKEAKRRYFFPENIMMENAAAALEAEVLRECNAHSERNFVLILCGGGNNGGDGLALARRLTGHINCSVYLTAEPKTEEAKQQLKMAQATGVSFISDPAENLNQYNIIVDCIFGTGFHGQLPAEISELFSKINETSAYKIACDIPSGLSFRADSTVTMGALKTDLFSDKAKNFTGRITVANLGISTELFNSCTQPDLYLIEKSDIKLPLRNNQAAHKGIYGHNAVIAGEKSGAAIIAATAALNFGSGLVTLVKAENSNLDQFKISPSLMISDVIPANTTCVQIGSGLGRTLSEEKVADISPNPSSSQHETSDTHQFTSAPKIIKNFLNWFKSTKNPACVLDADIFYYKDFPKLLEDLNKTPGAKIIMTPHPKELLEIVQSLTNAALLQGCEDISTVTQTIEQRQKIGEKITESFKNVTVIMKSANTIISTSANTFLVADGTPALAKAGSGDVLAGMNSALLAQGYTAKDAAITATEAHALASCFQKNKGQAFDLTPEKLIENLGKLSAE